MSNVAVSMKLTPKQAGALYQESMRLEKEVKALKLQIEQLQEKNGGLILDNHALSCMVQDLRMAIMSNCYDDPSESGKQLIDLANKVPEQCLREINARAVESLKFPTMFRKMWSGGEVQKWLQEEANLIRQQEAMTDA